MISKITKISLFFLLSPQTPVCSLSVPCFFHPPPLQAVSNFYLFRKPDFTSVGYPYILNFLLSFSLAVTFLLLPLVFFFNHMGFPHRTPTYKYTYIFLIHMLAHLENNKACT